MENVTTFEPVQNSVNNQKLWQGDWSSLCSCRKLWVEIVAISNFCHNVIATSSILYFMTIPMTLSKLYRNRLKAMQILLSRTQAGPGRADKQAQEQTSRNHVQAF